MRRLFLTFALILLLPLLLHASELPPLQGRVNDTAQMLLPTTVQQLERDLATLEQTDSTQIVVLTIPSLNGETIEGFGIRLTESWRIGQKGLDNGAILIISRADRKIRLEVGRGLEGKLTDFLASEIIRNDMAPRFRTNDFDGGIRAGVASLVSVVKGEYQAKARSSGRVHRGPAPLTLFLAVAVVSLFLSGVSRILSGIAGAIGVPLVAFFAFSGIGMTMLLILAGIGLVVGLILPLLFGNGGGGYGGPFWWGGGGFGGGSGDGGFFGGGGDFGGGGASGDW